MTRRGMARNANKLVAPEASQDHRSNHVHRGNMATKRPAVRLIPNSDVLTERLGDEVAVLNLKTNRFILLNDTGARFWELLQSGRDIPSIEEQLRSEFEVDSDELAADVKRMLRSLKDEQLILSD
jgi:Coenzyme PQQ synthesis protein D (PqqD)